MTMNRKGSKSTASKKTSGGKKAPGLRGKDDPPIIRLHLEGNLKRADIRKAVLAVLKEKIAASRDS